MRSTSGFPDWALRGAMVICSAKSVSIQRVCTPNRSALVKSAWSITARWNGSTEAMPSMLNSARARRARVIACSRVAPVTISLAIIESQVLGTLEPLTTPLSRPAIATSGLTVSVICPGVGKKPLPASSALMRNSKLWPRGVGVSLNDNGRPSAIRSCSITKSTPVVSSVTGCSTCKRVLTSRNDRVPSWLSRNSTVPAPT
ncbi:hypothetical protein ALQ30_200508 [Pseudomonas syringae pv. persicae]|uniref:Uncharacterized protein n=1 Tax=Pseudomonas syringae pv. persicae TaxID=237306 RepID=A0A3M3ZW88_9PSED|nr:hypothetical protein ALQ30_200508 [Pseudomonas syringae pv. persicae]